VVSRRIEAAAKGLLVAAVPTCLAAGISNAPMTLGHVALIAVSLIAASGVASLSDRGTDGQQAKKNLALIKLTCNLQAASG